MKKYLLIFIGVFTLSFTAKAQDGFEAILLADSNDANKLMQAYFNPAMKGFIYSMNNGWYHTAKVHKKFGFDLTIGLSASIVPTKDEVFNIASLGLTSITSASTEAQTFAGENTTTPLTVTRTLTISDPTSPAFGQSQVVTGSFDMPGGATGGLPLNAVPAPIVQLNLGLPFKIDAMLRILPKMSIGDDGGNVDMLGIGIKKEITSWFGPLDKLPLHVSLLAAYTTLNVEYGIDDDAQTTNGLAEFNLKAYTVQAIASLNFPFINVYGGFGYSSGTSNLKMTGNFSGEYNYTIAGTQYSETISLTPPDLAFSASGMKTTIGARLSLGFFKIFADYTLQEYNTVSAGIAISIR